jgi:cell division protein FtsI (penicillin-binding protein 3)
MTKLPDQRLRLILVLSSLAFAVVVSRAVYIQVVQASALAAKAHGQQNSTIIVPTSRGRILDSTGQPFAQDVAAKDLMVHPAEVQDPVQTASFIAQMIGFKPKHRKALLREVNLLVPRLTPPGNIVEARVIPQLDSAIAAKIMAAKPPGLFVTDSVRRDYPTHRQASQLLGYTDFTNSGADGAGIEQQYNNVLTGRPGERLEVQGPDGLPLDTITLRRPRSGRDVQLTINRAIQAKVQSVIDGTVQQFHAHSATAIVLNPKTGEILAMASSPGYDNNTVHDLPARRFHDATQNMAVEYSYEPGSTFKVVTMAAALTNHIVYPWSEFKNLQYSIKVGDKIVHDDAPRGPKNFTVRQILQESSNVGTVTIARMVGRTLLSKWIDRFGFGHTTGVDLPGEAPGILLPPDKWYDSSIGNIPIGQGIAVTPMQMAAMYSAIANGGVLVQPHVVKRIEGESKPGVASRRILDAGIDRELVNMLKGVVDTATGTGVRARIPGYTVAGKTGTAQKALAHGLGYSTSNYVASFVGFLPADDPQVEVLVVVDSPRGNIFGGYVAAPAFKDIATSLTQLLAIPPDRPITQE